MLIREWNGASGHQTLILSTAAGFGNRRVVATSGQRLQRRDFQEDQAPQPYRKPMARTSEPALSADTQSCQTGAAGTATRAEERLMSGRP